VRIWIDGPRCETGQVAPRIVDRVREMSKPALPNFFVMEEPLAPPAVGRMSEIKTPALVVVGELDDPSLHAIADWLVNQIAGAREVVIPGAAHLPNMEKPQEFDRIVLEFLQGK
jgi:pimeloyl-ACP methyl ester carboxylesterase